MFTCFTDTYGKSRMFFLVQSAVLFDHVAVSVAFLFHMLLTLVYEKT